MPRDRHRHGEETGLSRRDFLKISGVAALLGGVGLATYQILREPTNPNQKLIDTVTDLTGITSSNMTQSDYFKLVHDKSYVALAEGLDLGSITTSEGYPAKVRIGPDGEPIYSYDKFDEHPFPFIAEPKTSDPIESTNQPQVKIFYVGSDQGINRFENNKEPVRQFIDSYLPADCSIATNIYILTTPIGQNIGNLGLFTSEELSRENLRAATKSHREGGELVQQDIFFDLAKIAKRYKFGLRNSSKVAVLPALANERVHIVENCNDPYNSQDSFEDLSTLAEILTMISPEHRNLLIGKDYQLFANFLANEIDLLSTKK
ncbi:MAG TPA: twin-arginine translocation signal domain-containing protein [Alphaproteobacteria bacterium]|jgi:hypothetical protein|nr:twin-arginine translocation signal domain-containing protein [Alphaproteobacteria bacterium]